MGNDNKMEYVMTTDEERREITRKLRSLDESIDGVPLMCTKQEHNAMALRAIRAVVGKGVPSARRPDRPPDLSKRLRRNRGGQLRERLQMLRVREHCRGLRRLPHNRRVQLLLKMRSEGGDRR